MSERAQALTEAKAIADAVIKEYGDLPGVAARVIARRLQVLLEVSCPSTT